MSNWRSNFMKAFHFGPQYPTVNKSAVRLVVLISDDGEACTHKWRLAIAGCYPRPSATDAVFRRSGERSLLPPAKESNDELVSSRTDAQRDLVRLHC